jgi:tRNA(fMet)-specific endonuclease VapC
MQRRLQSTDSVGTTWVTAAELFYGAAKSREPRSNRVLVEKFLVTLPIYGLDTASTEVFGEAKALLERSGRRLADADLLIAAISVAMQATVVTGNVRHYERIPGVTVENWIRDE